MFTSHHVCDSLVCKQGPFWISICAQPSRKNKRKAISLHMTRPDSVVLVVRILVGNSFDFLQIRCRFWTVFNNAKESTRKRTYSVSAAEKKRVTLTHRYRMN